MVDVLNFRMESDAHTMNLVWVRLLSFSLAVSTIAGCDEQTSAVTTPADFDGRLKAADHLDSEDERDDAFARIAIDAADAGISDVAQKAVGLIRSETLRDHTATDAVARLMAIGQSTAAFDVAALIRSESLRSDTLANIAAGD